MSALQKHVLIQTLPSASAATIARIPYVHDLGDASDFLYATTDVAIWSCSETGLGITAACCATLRPIWRMFTSHAKFLPSGSRSNADPESRGPSRLSYLAPTGASRHGKGSRGGYERSWSTEEFEQLTLRGLEPGLGSSAKAHTSV